MSKRELAENYFKEGYNCAQAVVLAFSEEIKMDKKTASMTASGFGGGFGRLREVCGAVSGMVFVLSALEGSFDPSDSESKMLIYKKVQELIGKFKEKNGSYICHELLNLTDEKISCIPDARTKEYYKKRPCALLVGDAAEILEEYFNK
ncbi:MAG: C_GCAxxG_C_C family protein [Clostridia bacterium]|nr:C_GCAxxG_C_C family protein [Clostridia bacterium]